MLSLAMRCQGWWWCEDLWHGSALPSAFSHRYLPQKHGPAGRAAGSCRSCGLGEAPCAKQRCKMSVSLPLAIKLHLSLQKSAYIRLNVINTQFSQALNFVPGFYISRPVPWVPSAALPSREVWAGCEQLHAASSQRKCSLSSHKEITYLGFILLR